MVLKRAAEKLMCFRIALAFAIRSHFLGNIYAQAMGKIGGVNQRKQRRLEQPAEQPAHQQHRLPESNSPLGLALLSISNKRAGTGTCSCLERRYSRGPGVAFIVRVAWATARQLPQRSGSQVLQGSVEP